MEGFKRAFDQYRDIQPNGVVQSTNQPSRVVAGGAVLDVEMPVTRPGGAPQDFFTLDSTRFRITKFTYYLDIDDEEAGDDPSQRDFHFQICLWLDDEAGSAIIGADNQTPPFYQFLACCDKAGRYLYDSVMPPMPNIRYQDRFILLAKHEIEVPPQWNFNTQLPVLEGTISTLKEWDYNNPRWQGILPWEADVYQPRPGFPGPWTGEGPDPRTPYIQGDGADMSREFRWGQETIQFGNPELPCDSLAQRETRVAGAAVNPDAKYWSGLS